jgi:hypothetical protein
MGSLGAAICDLKHRHAIVAVLASARIILRQNSLNERKPGGDSLDPVSDVATLSHTYPGIVVRSF